MKLTKITAVTGLTTALAAAMITGVTSAHAIAYPGDVAREPTAGDKLRTIVTSVVPNLRKVIDANNQSDFHSALADLDTKTASDIARDIMSKGAFAGIDSNLINPLVNGDHSPAWMYSDIEAQATKVLSWYKENEQQLGDLRVQNDGERPELMRLIGSFKDDVVSIAFVLMFVNSVVNAAAAKQFTEDREFA